VEDGGVKRRTATRQLKAAQTTAVRTVEDGGVKRRAAPRQLLLEAPLIAQCTVEDGDASTRAAPRVPQATRPGARRTVEDCGVKRRAAPRQLLLEATLIARRTVEASAALWRAAAG